MMTSPRSSPGVGERAPAKPAPAAMKLALGPRILLRSFLAGARGPVVRPSLELVREVVDLEAGRVAVRVHVALPVPELPAVVRAVAEGLRRLDRPVLADVGRRLAVGTIGGVGLRRPSEID